jgi:pimeloyl-ACP methyl ester carboxylesterase
MRCVDVVVGDLALHVEADGSPGAPPVLLLHGITSSHRTWDWIVPRLVDRYRVLRLDFRGHGGSDRAPHAYRPAGYLSDAVAACEQAAGGPCIVIGHSLGAVTAAALAQRHPALVRGAVLEDPPLYWRPPGAPVEAPSSALLAAFALLRQSIPILQASGAARELVAGMLRAAPSPSGPPFGDLLCDDGIASMAAGMLDVDPAVLDPVLSGGMEPVLDPTVPIDRPVRIVAADPAMPDAVARPDDIARLVAASPGVLVHTIEGAGHLIHDLVDARERFWSSVDAFLGAIG